MKSESVSQMHFRVIWGAKFQIFFPWCPTDSADSKETQFLGKNGCRNKCFNKSLDILQTHDCKGGHIMMTTIIKISFTFASQLTSPVIIEVSGGEGSFAQQPYEKPDDYEVSWLPYLCRLV